MELRPCIRYYWRYLFLAGFVLVLSIIIHTKYNTQVIPGGIIIAGAILFGIFVHRHNFIYIISPEYVESRRGLISVNSTEIACRDIRVVIVRQGFVGRILNFGDVEIGSSAEHSSQVVLKGVSNPMTIRGMMSGYRGNVRQN